MKSDYKSVLLPKINDFILVFIGAMLCGMGCGFVNYASLGMDSIGIFYDGIRNLLKLSPSQIGTASYVVCFIISLFLWFADRKYVSIGSVIYIVMYGAFANLGTSVWMHLPFGDSLYLRVAVAVLGLAILYVGLSIYITVDIGVDAFTGLLLWICDITQKKMKVVKIVFDMILTLIGILIGGKLGVFTVISIFIGGPSIDFLTKRFQKIYFRNKL